MPELIDVEKKRADDAETFKQWFSTLARTHQQLEIEVAECHSRARLLGEKSYAYRVIRASFWKTRVINLELDRLIAAMKKK